ncbi:MAG TPA: hypothetical protein VFZ70_10395 [Euzebyales bacterium]
MHRPQHAPPEVAALLDAAGPRCSDAERDQRCTAALGLLDAHALDHATAMERALELVGADGVRRAQVSADGTAHGVGVAVFIERAGGQPDSSEYARVELTSDGPAARVSSLVDYLAPTAPDLPDCTTDRLVGPAPSNPLGVEGGGEAGCIGAPPAIVNAALDALRPHGVTHLDVPLHPEQVWCALQAVGTSDAPRATG